MSNAVAQALEGVYQSLHENNKDIDIHIARLKDALAAGGEKGVTIDPARLAQNNRQGRKMMQSYFRKRGVEVNFSS